MKQNIFFTKAGTKKFFLIAGTLVLVFAAISSVGAQEMIPVMSGGMESDATLGTPIDEIISAVSSGGLSGNQDFFALKLDTEGQSLENSISLNPEVSGSEDSSALKSNLNSSSLKDLELKGGLSSDPQINADTPSVFNLAVKFFEKVVFKKEVEFSGRPVFDDGMDISGSPIFDKDTAGYAIIKSGNQSVVVEFDHEYIDPPVVTATLSLQQYKDSEVRSLAEELLFLSDVKYIITNVSKKGFEIMMDKKADSDIPFSWHALAVNDPTTSKKKGGSLKNKIGSESGSNFDAASLLPEASQVPSNPNAANGNTSN
jgi:hypothetical protein